MTRVALVLIVVLLASCYMIGTKTPGVKRCTYFFFIIGYHRECEQGPAWGAPVPAPSSAKPKVAWWCSRRRDGISVCTLTPADCDWIKVSKGVEGHEACLKHDRAWCSTNGCFASKEQCVAIEQGAGADGTACIER